VGLQIVARRRGRIGFSRLPSPRCQIAERSGEAPVWKEEPMPLTALNHYFIRANDPNGLTIALNFFGIESVPAWGGVNYAEMPRVGGAPPR
jgi:hypothetical protein